MTPPKLLWKIAVAGMALMGFGVLLEAVFPSPGPGWEDQFDVFGNDDDEL